jgi:hypothetical protein
LRLEEKQREARKQKELAKEDHKPLWFSMGKHKESQEDIWLFNNKYWLRSYSDCYDLY